LLLRAQEHVDLALGKGRVGVEVDRARADLEGAIEIGLEHPQRRTFLPRMRDFRQRGVLSMTRMPSWSPVLLVLALGMLAACGDIKGGAAPTACVKADARCTLPSGVLGVCNVVDCAQGQAEPCLICRSQH
jgi:hypothetical protein